ncbi:DNA topoisomerase IB [Flavobacterium salilacus subsp. salilacus]|uniref:DNA topoisomerase IB n=1 Tax=Flavobacterium TaxID=237 RepID=UPI001074BA2C|nr:MULTISPECIES: DNA topoisomerase IB [Flavobacterium]KAF2518755.1 DNA topoisomerase IB [Flavobacterium salilacus subsp. salilacus]MBE1613722.1 DNA topoisomerase IB [Flavobacterium sp. SaA2.13]
MNTTVEKLEKIGSNPKVTAKAVGLRYALQSDKGYYRKRKGNGFTYTDHEGNTVKNKELRERFKKLVIPPAWTDVWISPYPNGHLQVTGIDAKGRKQYRYHPDWNTIRNQSKFYRLRRFGLAISKIRQQVEKDLRKQGLPYEKVVALVVKLIELTHIRIGNDAYKKLYGSFGLTTLRDKHVKFKGNTVNFEFTGKKGIKHKIKLQSSRLAKLVQRCKEVPGYELFQYYDDEGNHHSIGSADVNNYIKNITGEDFTAKDFRAWAGSINALCGFLEIGKHCSDADCKKKIVAVLDTVAKKLGNTRTVCKKYYVHPTVIASYEKGAIWNYKPRKTKDADHSAEEKALLKLLTHESIAEVLT